MLFHYSALKDNKRISKTIEADNEKAVVSYLQKSGYFPLDIKTVTPKTFFLFDRIAFTDIVDFTRHLAIMLTAGLTLVDSFDILKKQTNKATLLKLIISLDKDVRGGNSFSSALKKYPQHFSNLYISLVKSGEASGKLSEILLRLADNLEKAREFRGKLKGALIYPIIVIFAMLIVMFIMITFVVPKLLNLYRDFNIELPATTQFLITISDISVKYWPLFTVFGIAFFIGFRKYLNTKQGKIAFDTFILKTPLIKNVVTMGALVDSTRTLSILTKSGVSILDGLQIVVETTENAVFRKAFKTIYKNVEKGVSLGNAMQAQEIFPPILVQMTIVGENTGHLDETLMRISTYFETESELVIKAITTLIEPAILLFLGLGVGFLVMAVITPIYNLTSSF